MKKHNYMFSIVCVFKKKKKKRVMKNVILLKEREKERKKIREKDKVVGP